MFLLHAFSIFIKVKNMFLMFFIHKLMFLTSMIRASQRGTKDTLSVVRYQLVPFWVTLKSQSVPQWKEGVRAQ